MKQNRFKSLSLWLSIVALVVFILKTYFNFQIPEIDTLVNMVITVLIGLGILNNPTDSEKF